MQNDLPQKQHAIQLVGPGELKHNPGKEVPEPGPHQVLAKVEAVGLCFSDLKLLKQFSSHARKNPVVKGLSPSVLAEIPSYVPGNKPTVPGHEVVCRIVAAGSEVRHHKIGERCLVQTDYRELRTPESNAAFGYNFEGGLQEYVLLDERVILDPSTGERFLIPVGEELGASAIALVEPWACVENSYMSPERRTLKAGGRALIVAELGHAVKGIAPLISRSAPAEIVVSAAEAQAQELRSGGLNFTFEGEAGNLPNESFDDVLYFGASARRIEMLNGKLAPGGLINIVLGGRRIGEPVSVGIGRIHYGMTRWIGTSGDDASESYATIPETGEIRPGDRIAVLGAAGPMGQMHVIRNLSSNIPGVTLVGTDIDDARLEALRKKAAPLSEKNGIPLDLTNSSTEPLAGRYSYYAVLVPAPQMVADAVTGSMDGCIINIFAGIPAPVRQQIDLDTYIRNYCYMIGTSGSVIRDMKIVLRKVEDGRLDTNCSIDAVSGMAGAVDGIAAVENRTLSGKIVVYPSLHEMGLIPLAELHRIYPSVAGLLESGQWTAAAEAELLRVAAV
jgi:L-sorbose 1-phosphate reductase